MVQFCGKDVRIEKDYLAKGMSVEVDSMGEVLVKVRVDRDYGESEIQHFVDRHRRFLNNRLADYSNVVLPDFRNGGKVRLLGKEYTAVRNGKNGGFSVDGTKLNVPYTFYRWCAKEFFGGLLLPHVKTLTELYAEAYGLRYPRVKLYTRKSAWGTYFIDDQTIGYNIDLIFLPEECIEYVVVHELCHSLQPNHSPAFWAEVEKIYPRYKEIDKQLNQYQASWLSDRVT